MKDNSLLDSINKKKKPEEINLDTTNIEGSYMPDEDIPMFEYPDKPDRRWEPNLGKQDINTLVAGATPLLVGLLTGKTGDALDVASAGIQKQEEIRREDDKSLMSYLQKRTIANQKATEGGKRRYQSVNYEDDEGVIRQGVFDKFTGNMKRSAGIAGYRKNVKKDPTTDELATFSGAKGTGARTKIEGQKPAKFTVKEEKDIKEVRKAFLGDKQVQASKKAIDTSSKAIDILNSKNPVGDEAMKTVFPRMFGEVGNLAAKEQDRFSGSQAFTRKFSRFKEKYDRGLLTPDDRADLTELATMVHAYDKRKLRSIADNYSKSEGAITGLSSEDLMGALTPLARQGDVLPKTGNKDVDARVKRIKELKAKLGKK